MVIVVGNGNGTPGERGGCSAAVSRNSIFVALVDIRLGKLNEIPVLRINI